MGRIASTDMTIATTSDSTAEAKADIAHSKEHAVSSELASASPQNDAPDQVKASKALPLDYAAEPMSASEPSPQQTAPDQVSASELVSQNDASEQVPASEALPGKDANSSKTRRLFKF